MQNHTWHRRFGSAAAAALLGASLMIVGCDDGADDFEDAADEVGDTVEDAAEETGDAIDDAVDDLDDGTQ